MADAGTVSGALAKDPLVLAIDVGTSSARAFVYDVAGNMVEEWGARRKYDVDTTPDGGVQVDGDRLVELVCECIGDTLSMMDGEAGRLTCVGCDTFWHSLMGVSADGKALTPVYTWADTRSRHAAEELRKRLDPDEVHARTGAVLHSSYLPAKLMWLGKSQPETAEKTAHWMSLGEYLYFRLFGERRVSVSMASATGLLDQRSCSWDSELLETLGVTEDALSPISEFTEAMQGLQGSRSRDWGRLNEIPWYLAVGDGAANNLGSGGHSAEWWVIMIGTSGALRVVRETDDVTAPPGLWSYRVDRRRVIQGGALSSGGNTFAWLSHALQVPTVAELEHELSDMPPDGHGLTVLPFLAGERSPDWDSDARASFVGLTLATRPVDIVRASLEAIAYRFALVERLLRKDAGTPEGIIGSGAGLLDSPAWMQIMTDVLGQPLVASATPEASSRGAALLALEASGAIESVSRVPAPLGTKYAPVEEHTRTYAAAIERQRDLYRKLIQ